MLKGELITLRPIELGDSEDINKMRKDFDGMKSFIGNPFPGNELSQREWIESMYPKGLLHNIYLAIEENTTKKFIGYFSARNINYIHSTAEVGGMINSDDRGKGYWKEVQIVFYNYLFNQLNLNKLHSIAVVDNELSIRNCKKIGFEEEGYLKEHVFQDGSYKDVILLSFFRQTFNKLYGNILDHKK